MEHVLHQNGSIAPARIAARGAALLALCAYVAVAAAASVIAPIVAPVFLAPFGLLILALIPQGRALPRGLMLKGLYLSIALLALWPVYLHVKPGPLPILTPPRLILYVLSAAWAFDLARSRLRRAQLAFAIRRSALLSGAVFTLFALGLLSLPLAEGRAVATPEYVRQLIIWLVPFLIALTYVRKAAELKTIVMLLTLVAAALGAIAIIEKLSGVLLATLLSPIIADNAEWLRGTQEAKIRDGVFRAQATFTHPLSLGEYLSLFLPFAIAFGADAKRGAARMAWVAAAALIAAGALATSSRAALLTIFVSGAAIAVILLMRFMRSGGGGRFRPLVGLATLMLLAASPVIALGGYKFVSGAGGVSASNSSQARIDQIKLAWPKIMKRPVAGYGVGRSTRILGFWGTGLTIDNYYLSLALDMGLAAPVAFVALIASIGWRGWKLSEAAPRRSRMLFAGFVAFAASFFLCRMILSQTGTLAVVYPLAGAFAGATAHALARRRNRV